MYINKFIASCDSGRVALPAITILHFTRLPFYSIIIGFWVLSDFV